MRVLKALVREGVIEMRKIVANLFKKTNIKLIYVLLPIFIVSAAISVYSLSKPASVTEVINDNSLQMETSYDYKATITPNILYPEGGTIEVGNTIFKKITTAIPFTLKSTVKSENEVIAKGTHEVQLVVKAGEFWDKTFPLESKQSFEQKGTDLSILNETFTIDLEKIKTFITQVEEETGIRPDQYVLEVVPNIQGTINYAEKESVLKAEDKLIFQYSYEEIKLASEKEYSSVTPFTTNQVIKNTISLFGFVIPLNLVQIVSMLLSVLLLIPMVFIYKTWMKDQIKPTMSQVDKINKKYGSRIITVSQKENVSQKSIFTLYSFKSLLKISDEKELPIFSFRESLNESATYFIIDGDYFYNYETSNVSLVRSTNKDTGVGKAYVEG